MQCEALIEVVGGRSGLCPQGCPAMFQIVTGPLRGQWVWLCDRHIDEYRHRGLVAPKGPDSSVPRPIEFESTSKIRKSPQVIEPEAAQVIQRADTKPSVNPELDQPVPPKHYTDG